uniref:GntR family transcriptional regulator n=1 Tax=OCS116 cluster bacterium TaxID=2030921 RepID=A0A2A4Z5J4_9PROT
MTQMDTKQPEHETIYHKIRNMILFGDVYPGQPITILGLKSELNAGMTPVREAIRRLVAEGALEALGNRRICVPVMNLSKLEQIRIARMAIEPKLAFMAAEHGGAHLNDELKRIDQKLDEAIDQGDIHGYLQYNYEFHFCLYEAANASILYKLALSLWLQIGPSLRIMCGKYGTSNLPDMHKELIQALSLPDAANAQKAIEQDILQGMLHVSEMLSSK